MIFQYKTETSQRFVSNKVATWNKQQDRTGIDLPKKKEGDPYTRFFIQMQYKPVSKFSMTQTC